VANIEDFRQASVEVTGFSRERVRLLTDDMSGRMALSNIREYLLIDDPSFATLKRDEIRNWTTKPIST